MTIEKAHLNDVNNIIAIGKKEMQDFSFNKEDLENYINNPNNYLVYVIKETKIIGFITLRISKDDAEIDAIAITKEFQHQGYGSKLLDKVIEDLINQGINNLLIEVRRKNMEAFRFYKKYNFISYRIRDKYYGDDDAICMKKELIKKEKVKVRRKNEIILALETSCDETAFAIIKNGTEIIANTINTQIEEHQKYGGVYPELASRLHLINIPKVLSYLMTLKDFDINTITHVAVTVGPGLPGALQLGLVAAKTIASYLNVPLVSVNHLAAHIYAGEFVEHYSYPAIALVASGGNSEIVLLNEELNFKIIGQTLDDAVGEALDKVARQLNIPYPGGANIDKLVKDKTYPEIKLPKINVEGYNFSYSGIKSHVIRMLEKEKKNKDGSYNEETVLKYAYNIQKAFIDQMLDKLFMAAKDYKIKNIILGGGVSANSYLRKEIATRAKPLKIKVFIPPLFCTTDNAAMVGLIASKKIALNKLSKFDIGIDPSLDIEKIGD